MEKDITAFVRFPVILSYLSPVIRFCDAFDPYRFV